MAMTDPIDIAEISQCTCLGVRRLARQMTQIYEEIMAPAGLTVGQFGLLAQLYGADLAGQRSVAAGALAERLGTAPTTLSRTLRPLRTQGLIVDDPDPLDRRMRAVRLTDKGRAKLRQTVPAWRRAQRQVNSALGSETATALRGALELSAARLAG
jgi:DNA-binding MarR family transcriptional regulator